MEWTRSDTLMMASRTCTSCHGLGVRNRLEGTLNPCHCVLREVFRTCFRKFQRLTYKEKSLSRVSLEYMPKGRSRNAWGRKDEEYLADFYLVTRRALNADEFRLFTWHYLLGADWRLCTRKMQTGKVEFFHALYRLEQKLGRVYSQLKPYPLYPLNDYFGTLHAVEDLRPVTPPPPAHPQAGKVVPIRPVLRPAAAAPPERKAA